MKRKVGALEKVEGDLINLQYKIRRDPASYADDFNRQYEQYLQKRELFDKSPELLNNTENESFMQVVDLVSHVAYCYKEKTASFPEELMQILREHHAVLKTEVQEKIISCLTMLRRKDVLDSATLLQTLFPLLTTTRSKSLRAFLFVRILSDVRAANQKSTDHRLNRTLQTVLYNLLAADRTSPTGLWAVKLTRELWKRQVWTDAKAVEIMKEACMSENEKVIIGGVRFFLGGDKEREELQDESSEEEIDPGQLKHQSLINKKTSKRKKDFQQAMSAIKKKERKKNEPHPLNFSALHLLHDPQGFAESVFYKHLQSNKSKLNLEQRLLVLQLVSRLVGLHKLTIISLYSYYIKYLNPRQQSVTTFLACLAQSSHSFVPPDSLEPLVLKIANEFVSEASASEVASAGLNTIREVCARQPLAMTDTLLQDLVQYKTSKDKGVMMAAKGLLSLYREVGADLLKKKDRGKAASMGIQRKEIKERKFGEVEKGEIEGLDLLEKWKAEEKQRKRLEKGLPAEAESGEEWEDEDEDDGWDGWEVESNGSTDSGGWLPVDSDVEIEVSDSDDEPTAKKLKTVEGGEDAFSKLATSTILTPADFAKLQELRLEAALDKELGGKKGKKTVAEKYHPDDAVTAETLESLAALSKRATKEERIAAAAAGKTDEHKSHEARRRERKAELGKSTTNKEKARKKNVLMTLGKARSKKKRSLMEQKRVLQAHVQRAKRGGRRGNIG
ncbi:MAG: Severe Depolymerization of Actin [Vezdaea aestivalis]|nr:MAG: Severe Depolymerization of Actin [Vezdaea aestivalis]